MKSISPAPRSSSATVARTPLNPSPIKLLMKRRHPASFSIAKILSETVSMFIASRRILFPAILTFSLMSAVIAGFLQQSVSRIEDRMAAENAIEWQELHDRVQSRLSAFTPVDAERLVRSFRGLEAHGDDDLAFAFILAVGPFVAVAFVLHLCVFFLACMFFLSLSTGALRSGVDLAMRLPLFAIRMTGLLLWLFARSLVWLPFIGPIIALYLIPRFVAAPFLYAGGHSSFFVSVQESMKLTRKRWWTILLSFLCLFVLSLAVLWFGIVIVALVSLFSSKLSYFLWLFLLMSTGALQMFFLSSLVRSLE